MKNPKPLKQKTRTDMNRQQKAIDLQKVNKLERKATFPKPLTPPEQEVFNAILAVSGNGEWYAPHEDTTAILRKTGFSIRSFAGYCSSLQKKGWIFCFTDPLRDIEVTCMALGDKKRSCNHHDCWCHERRTKK